MFITLTSPNNYHLHLWMFTVNQLSVSFCDVIADALTVERTELRYSEYIYLSLLYL